MSYIYIYISYMYIYSTLHRLENIGKIGQGGRQIKHGIARQAPVIGANNGERIWGASLGIGANAPRLFDLRGLAAGRPKRFNVERLTGTCATAWRRRVFGQYKLTIGDTYIQVS